MLGQRTDPVYEFIIIFVQMINWGYNTISTDFLAFLFRSCLAIE